MSVADHTTLPPALRDIVPPNSGPYDTLRALITFAETKYRTRTQEVSLALETAKSLARSLGTDEELALALTVQGRILAEDDEFPSAEVLLLQALELLESGPASRASYAKVKVELGVLQVYQGDEDEAIRYLLDAVELARQGDEPVVEARALGNIGTVYATRRDFEQALRFYERALPAFERQEAHNLITVTMVNMGESLVQLGRLEEAEDCLERSLQAAREKGNEPIEAAALDGLGQLYRKRGSFDQARSCLRKSFELTERHSPSQAATTRLRQADNELEAGDKDAAMNLAQEALVFARKNPSNLVLLRDSLLLIARAMEACDRCPEAVEAYKEAIDLESSIRNTGIEERIRTSEREALRTAKRRLESLERIGRELTSHLDLSKIVESLYREINSVMDAEVFGIASYDPDNRRIEWNLFLEQGRLQDPQEASIDDPNSLAGWTIRNGRDIVIHDLEHERESYFEDWDQRVHVGVGRRGEDPESLIFRRLTVRGEVVGVMTVQSYRKYAYTRDDVEAFRILSAYTAIAMKNAQQARTIRKQNEKLRALASVDPLTGILNRRAFEERASQQIALSARDNEPLGFILADGDLFKEVNDQYGHMAGDHVLRTITDTFRGIVKRQGDILARYGGEEFVVVVANVSEEELAALAESLRAAVEDLRVSYDGQIIRTTVSLGAVSVVPVGPTEQFLHLLFERADRALYKAKEAGRNRVMMG